MKAQHLKGLKTIVLAEDDEDDQEIIMMAIRKLDPYRQFHIANNGREVVNYLSLLKEEELPCLIVLDLNMPVLNGLQTLEELNKNVKYSNIPKVIFTTSDSEEDKRKCLQHGAADYVVKPANMNDVVRSINNIIAHCD